MTTDPPPAGDASPLPQLTLTDGWETLMDGAHRAELERSVLPRYLLSQRWFGAKSRTLASVSIRDRATLLDEPAPACLVQLRASFRDGSHESYIVPLALVTGAEGERHAQDQPGTVLARVSQPGGEAILIDATAHEPFCRRLLEIIDSGLELPGETGQIRGVATSALPGLRGDGDPGPVRRGSGEQSNTTLIFGDRLLLKLFRRVEPGINLDFEIGRFLTETTHFTQVPKTAGAIESILAGTEPTTLAILQDLVPSQGQGWEWFLGVLARYYDDVVARPDRIDRPWTAGGTLFDLSESAPRDDVVAVVEPAIRAAAVLGRRTAELHLALSGSTDNPAFAPEPLTGADLRTTADRIQALSREVFATLGRHGAGLDSAVRPLAEAVLAGAPSLAATVGELTGLAGPLVKIRCHGDYHLGQVLRQDDDFVILDFEGEPGRTMAVRRAKQPPLKDVAGMLRSFDYAASSALLTATRDRPDALDDLEPWAVFWQTWTSAAFLREYRATAATAPLVPTDRDTARRLLDALMLEKILFELRYELDYRPAWVRIPLLGLLNLVEPGGAATSS